MNYAALVVLALAASTDAARLGNNGWLGGARLSASASVDNCKLNGVEGLNLGGTLSTDLNDETQLEINYDYNDLNAGEMPKDVKLTWSHSEGGNNYGVEADINLADKSATADITVGNGDVSVTANVDSNRDGFVTSVEGSTQVDLADRKVNLNPSYDVADGKAHLTATTSLNDDIGLELGMDLNNDPAATLKVDYAIDGKNSVSGTVNLRDSSMTYEYTRSLGDDSEITANVDPTNNVAIEWTEGSWTTNVNVPWGNTAGSEISFKKDFEL